MVKIGLPISSLASDESHANWGQINLYALKSKETGKEMKKQELIHLHGLLAEVPTYCQENYDISFDVSRYEQLKIRPTSIHQSKTDHKNAVFSLAEGICATLDPKEEVEQIKI